MARQENRIRSEESFLLEMDRIGISMGILLTAMTSIYLPFNWLHHPKCMQAVRQMMLVIVIKLLYWKWCSTYSWFYKGHRLTSLLVLNGIEYGACLLYIPVCFEVAMADQLAAGRANTCAYSMLLSGLSSFEIALQCLALRLPLQYAGPIAILKMVLALQLLPGQIQYLQIPEVDLILTSLKRSVDQTFSVLAATVAPVDVRFTITSVPCPKVALLVWFHLCLAGLLPLYVLLVTTKGSPDTSNVPPSSTSILYHLQYEHDGPNNAAGSLGCTSSSSSSSNPNNSRGSSSNHPHNAVQAFQQQQQQQHDDDSVSDDWFAVQSGNNSWASTWVAWCCHALVLLLSGFVLWAVVEIAAVAVGDFATSHGLCV
jgi:hypothetical protein